jgi:hypothetical protein
MPPQRTFSDWFIFVESLGLLYLADKKMSRSLKDLEMVVERHEKGFTEMLQPRRLGERLGRSRHLAGFFSPLLHNVRPSSRRSRLFAFFVFFVFFADPFTHTEISLSRQRSLRQGADWIEPVAPLWSACGAP